jgi:protein-disulfide isomerase
MKLQEHTPGLTVSVTEKDHAQGPPDAPATLVEYGDYECPYCGASYPIVKRLREALGDRLRFVFRNFPLNSVHPHASVAAQAAEAAAAQGKFWEMHDMLFEHQSNLADADLTQYALKLGLEPYRFQSDLSSERFADKVQADFRGGVRSGVNGTPTFFINGVRYDGPNRYEELLAALQRAEAGQNPNG